MKVIRLFVNKETNFTEIFCDRLFQFLFEKHHFSLFISYLNGFDSLHRFYKLFWLNIFLKIFVFKLNRDVSVMLSKFSAKNLTKSSFFSFYDNYS